MYEATPLPTFGKKIMKVAVLYYSHKGKTAFYAREIAMYLWSQGFSVSLSAVSDFNKDKLKEVDFLITGCWTCGWFVVNQHPHQKWVEFSKEIAGIIPPERTLLFTTYKFRTGSMFSNMKKALSIPKSFPVYELKSKTGFLTEEDKLALNRFTNVSPLK